jgi:hypothetical protein
VKLRGRELLVFRSVAASTTTTGVTMKLSEYLDIKKLQDHVRNGLIEDKKHPHLPLRILTYTRQAMFSQAWDATICKCRGLIVDTEGEIVSRPFEKFFDVDTDGRPETYTTNLPLSAPVCLEKINGNLGILYEVNIPSPSVLDPASVVDSVRVSGVASKGSFTSKHAKWATDWYHKTCPNPQWPEGHTVVFEMVCESIQPHAVCYGGVDKLVLLALINTETGEELDYNTLYHYAFLNGLEVPGIYAKSLGDVLGEDRTNAEGYVLSWPRPKLPPTRIRVKFPRFLKLRKLFYAAKPKAILEALRKKDISTLEGWQETSNQLFSANVTKWISTFSQAYGEIRLQAVQATLHARMGFARRREAVNYLSQPEHRSYASVALAMMDEKEADIINRRIWRAVENQFCSNLNEEFCPNGC